MRWVLGLLVVLATLPVAAQPKAEDPLPPVYYHRPTILVTEIPGEAGGVLHCAVVVANLVDRMRLRWSLDGEAIMVMVDDPLVFGPLYSRSIRIQLLLDGNPVRAERDPSSTPAIIANVYGGSFQTGELHGLPKLLQRTQVISIRHLDGLGRDARYMLPNMPPLLEAVDTCRKAIKAR